MTYSGFVGHGNVFLSHFYNFLAPTALTCANKGGTRELFSLFRPALKLGYFFTASTANEHGHKCIIPDKHCDSPPPPFLPRLVNACLATVCGYGPTCGGVLFSFFPPSRSLKNGDFSYRSRVPTAGICLWWISWAPPSSIIVANIPRKVFQNYGAIFGASAFQNIGTNR